MARRPAKKTIESRLTTVERGIRSLQANDATIITIVQNVQQGFARMENRLEQVYNHVDGFMKLHETLDIGSGSSKSRCGVPQSMELRAKRNTFSDFGMRNSGLRIFCLADF
jgi:hypothetical protein